MVCLPVNSKDGIKLSLDTPLNNRPCLNILCPGVLRQYFDRNVTGYLGQNSSDSSENNTIVKRYTHGLGSGTSSVGMDIYNFMTQKTSDTMKYMADELHCIIKSNKTLLNMDGVDMI